MTIRVKRDSMESVENLCSILRIHKRSLVGAYGDEVTPVPIPNTEVKLIRVENTWLATAWKDRTVPTQRERDLLKVSFVHSSLAQSVERSAVNRNVVGSSPTRGASMTQVSMRLGSFSYFLRKYVRTECR